MHVGMEVKGISDEYDDYYRELSQLGVDHISAYMPRDQEEWTAEGLTRCREHVEKFGLSLDVILLPMKGGLKSAFPHIMLGKDPERDRELDRLCDIIRACAKAGIPAVHYTLYLYGLVRTESVKGRGGSLSEAFDFKEAIKNETLTEGGQVDADTMWERIDHFLARIVPVAEEYKIRMGIHPPDPPMPRPRGFRGVDNPVGCIAGIKKFIELHPSPYHGLSFCQGTISEMLEKPGEEIYDIIRYFGSRKKIFHVHFRNIRGGFLKFSEQYIDDGDVDMYKAARTYKEVDYPYMLQPDHVPRMVNNTRAGFAFTMGYIKALIDVIEKS